MSSWRPTGKMMKFKRTRNRLSLDLKMNIIRMLEKGHKVHSVARLHNLNESTIRTINRNADVIKMLIKEALPTSCKVQYRRDKLIVKMEKLLIEWIEDNKNRIDMTMCAIQSKALSIFNELKVDDENTQRKEKSTTFLASKGWYNKFKKRYNVHNILYVNETERVDKNTGVKLVNSFKVLNNDDIEVKEEAVEELKYEEDTFCENGTKVIEVKEEIMEEEQEDDDELTPNLFTTQNIHKCLSTIQKVINFIEIIDPNSERSGSIGRGLKATIAPYEVILAERIKAAKLPTG